MKERIASEMQELIKINVNDKGERLVSARELKEFLEIKTELRKWFPRMCEYGFEEGRDFTRVSQKCPTLGGTQNVVDYAITIDMAKEISMIQRTEKGKKARQYFIACEKKLKNLTTDSYMIQDPVERAKRWIEEEQQRQLLVAQIEKDKPKVQFFDAVAGSKDSIEMGQVAKVLGIKSLGRNKLFELLRENKVLQKDNIPYQKYVDAGYFRVLEQKYTVPSGETKVNIKTMVFQKGVDYIRKLVQPS